MSESVKRPRITVARGATITNGDESWERIDYGIEDDVPEGLDIKSAIRNTEAMLEGMIEEKRQALLGTTPARKSASRAPTPQTKPAPALSLDQLPWKPYPSKKGYWIGSSTRGAEKLLVDVKAAKNQVFVSGDYKYKLQGDGKFIARYPKNA